MSRGRISRRELLTLAGVAGLTAALPPETFGAARPAGPHEPDRGARLQKTMIWASAPAPVGADAYFVAFRKQFTLAEAPRAADLHLFADARYLLWVNGRYVTRGPARFHPQGPEYDTVPIGPYLNAGVNTLAVLVMANASNGKMMRHAPGLTARLEGTGAAPLITDPSWRWSDQTRYRAPLVEWGNVRDRIDATVEDGDWTRPEYDDSHWRASVPVDGAQWGPLTARRIPLLRETPLPLTFPNGQTLPVTLTAGQEIVFDAGRFTQAYTALDMDADADTRLILSHAGVTYTTRAGRQTYLTSDTCGFLRGSVRVAAGRVTLHGVQAVERLYPFDCAGSFHSSDPVLDSIWAMCARSVQLCSEDSYVDCADRERTEWMDDDPPAFNITRTALAGPGTGGVGKRYADPRLLEELLRRTALTLQPGGWVKAHTCSDRFDIHAMMEDRACDWVQGARRYYESAGNVTPIREIWPAAVAQMNWFLDRRTARGLVRAREWVVWGNPMGYQTCEGAGLNAFVYKALVDAAYLGGVIGERKQAARFAQAAHALAHSFNTVLWDDASGTYYSGFFGDGDAPVTNQFTTFRLKVVGGLAEPTMFPALFALDQGIVPANRRAQVARYLLAHRAQADRLMTFHYLFQQLYDAHDDALDREVLDTIRAKWQGMAQTGWKVSWEEFSGGSRAHIYGAFPGYYLSAYVLGVRPDGPVWERRLRVEPRLGGLTAAAGTVVTEHGPVPVAWTRGADRLDFQVTIPAGVTAAITLPRLGADTRLVVDGRPASVQALTLGGGHHSGSLFFTPAA